MIIVGYNSTVDGFTLAAEAAGTLYLSTSMSEVGRGERYSSMHDLGLG